MIYEILPVNNYQGNGSSTVFDFDFYIENAAQLSVYLFDESGTKHQLELNVDYTINELKNKNGSYITFPIEGSDYGVLNSEQKISLELTLPISQETQYNNSSLLNLEALEYSLDYLTRLIQILARKIALCLKVEECSENTPDELFASINEARVTAINYASAAQASANNAQASANNAQTSANKALEQAQVAIQQVTDIAEVVEELDTIETNFNNSLATKANTNADNFTNEAKGNIATLSFPSAKRVDLALGASGTVYTAPASGYYQLYVASASGSYVHIWNQASQLNSGVNRATGSSDDICVGVPALKGETVKISYSGVTKRSFYFIYTRGAYYAS